MKYRCVMFDLDGTLIDTEKAVLKAWQLTLREYGYEFELPQLRMTYGVTNESALRMLHAEADEHFDERWILQYDRLETECTYFPGAEETLRRLKDLGCMLGAVTSRNRAEFSRYFGRYHLERYMDAIILEEDTVLHKPEAEPILKCMNLLHARPAESIYIGDMPTDAECAGNAGIAAAIVSWNGIPENEAEADYMLHSVSEILDIMN